MVALTALISAPVLFFLAYAGGLRPSFVAAWLIALAFFAGFRAVWAWLLPFLLVCLWIGLFPALGFGGLDFISHFALRFILRRRLPWDLPRLLDYAAGCVLLRKVGAGYIFIHRLLLEYFASLA